MVHTNPEFENFEFDQHLESHKYVINIFMWFRDMGCYNSCLLIKTISVVSPFYIQ
jgi:hypothetical protein